MAIPLLYLQPTAGVGEGVVLMRWDEQALPASGKTAFDHANRPETRRSQWMLTTERPDPIHVAFDDHRPATGGGPVLPICHGYRQGTVTPIAADYSQLLPQAADHHLHAVHAGIQRLRHRRAPPRAGS